ncbi:hypothetical protein FHU33_0841 [Blastococcus colisei]|uniref:Uncharacterized protein n=1 Tax=Blastococcus colisei TaxID=1564162 RepID=A0A543PBK3_9ACTN|nr:hypothetical protein [Blastococcus colisei]TQN41473.1 hypothetical protein FHU33_0841 [Blastococcus colisei]
MSVPSRRNHRATLVTVALAGGLVVLPPTTASADPPDLDLPTCSSTLARAQVWPGLVPTPEGQYRHVSDGFVSYLLRQPECTATGN